jgi:ABC-type nitrate/sulfonate/bicarbonate transport system substrate-binding protein
MVARVFAARLAAVLCSTIVCSTIVCSTIVLAPLPSAHAEDLLKVAVAQRGQWDTAITELGERSGIFKKRGIAVTILYTQGGPEAHQAVISGSMDIACGGGIESAIGGFSKGAPVRIIGSAMIGSPDTYWFVVANSRSSRLPMRPARPSAIPRTARLATPRCLRFSTSTRSTRARFPPADIQPP